SAFYSSSLSTVRASSSLVLLSALLFYLSSASTSSYPLSLHDALPISGFVDSFVITTGSNRPLFQYGAETLAPFPFNHKKMPRLQDRKSTRLNSSHVSTSYAVFCLTKTNACAS